MKIAKFDNKSRKKFTLLVGDEGVILTYSAGKKLLLRFFANHESTEDLNEITNILSTNVRAPVEVLIDVMEQSYIPQSFPPISSFNIKKLVDKKIARDFSPEDLKNSIFVMRGRDKAEWHYLFVGCSLSKNILKWLNFIQERPNPLGNICLLPIESYSVVSKIISALKYIKSSDKEDTPVNTKGAYWQLLVAHNKVGGGFRQVAFRNGKVVFTRLINVDSEESPNFLAGSIQQEIINSVEYLKRLSFEDEDYLDLYVVVAQQMKNSLRQLSLKASNVNIFTPYEVANLLGYESTALEEDRFADIVLVMGYVSSKPILPVYNQHIRKLQSFQRITKFIHWPSIALVPILITASIFNQYSAHKSKSDIDYYHGKLSEIQTRLNSVKKRVGEFGSVEALTDMSNLYKILADDSNSPLLMITEFIKIKGGNVLVKSVNWRSNLLDVVPVNAPGVPKVNASSMVLDIEFYNVTTSYQDLFDEFDKFIKVLSGAFTGYDIQYSRLTDKINFNDATNKTIPVQITISGPKR
jgi:hypothetical protein